MGAETAGRKLGIGLRLAAKAVQQRATQAAAAPNPSKPQRPAPPAFQAPMASRAATASHAAAQAKSGVEAVARGTKRFGQAIWGPMAHTGGVLWLEISGLFFALFAVFFGQNAYRMRHNYASGPDHTHFLVYLALTGLFAWFTASSFYRARQKEKRNRARQAVR